MLKNIPSVSNTFKFFDLEAGEIVTIIVSISSLKISDEKFLNNLVESLYPKMKYLDNTDLINLAR